MIAEQIYFQHTVIFVVICGQRQKYQQTFPLELHLVATTGRLQVHEFGKKKKSMKVKD